MRPLAVGLILATALACICSSASVSAASEADIAAAGSRAALDANAQGLSIVQGASPDFAQAADHFHRAYTLSWTRIKSLRRTLRSARAEVAQAREDAAEDPSESLTAADEAALDLLKKQVQQSKQSIYAERKMAAEYLNNEAVSYMRLQKMNDAKRVLDQALTLSPHADAISNLKHVEEYLRSASPQKQKKAQSKDEDEEEDDDEEEEEEEAPRKKQHQQKKSKAKASKKRKQKQAKTKKQAKRRRSDDDEEDDAEQPDDDEEEEEEPKPKKKKQSKKKRKQKKAAAASSNDTAPPAASSTPRPRPAMDRPRRPNRTHRDPLPRIHLLHWDWEENRQYAQGLKPFILIGALDRWNLSVWNPAALAALWPDTLVDFYPHNMEKSTVRPFIVNMSTAITEQSRPSGKFPHSPTHGGAYIQWNVRSAEWEQIMRVHAQPPLPDLMRKDDAFLMPPELGGLGDAHACLHSAKLRNEFSVLTHWRMVLVGNRGAGMFNHQDVLRTASFQAQVVGSKRWHICAPDQSRFLYAPGTLDTFDPDYERYPLYAQARCYEDVVSAGEVVFYPADYWHQTENQASPTIALTATVMDQNNHDLIAGELEAECAVQKYKWGFSEELCANLRSQCFAFWRQHFKQGAAGNPMPPARAPAAVKDEL